MSDRQAQLRRFEERLGYRFRRPELLERALTHRSYANERGLAENYERLEFLGDAVLGLATAEKLFDETPPRQEGELTRSKGHLVSARVLAELAETLELGAILRLGVGEERSGGRGKGSLLADALEAVLGAVFRDGGYAEARRVVAELLERAPAPEGGIESRDAKTTLQELAQASGWGRPRYQQIAVSGPDHDKLFTVECRLDGGPSGSGTGRTKKEAEQQAAAAVLGQLE
ncbi:MAG: ribonuclease III [Thermoanaerobaculia bacterium]